MTLYKYLPVWSRADDAVVLYRCFEVIGSGFTVQSKDFFFEPGDAARAAQLEIQFCELLRETAPEARFPVQPSIEAAIAAFDAHFGRE